MSGRGSRIVDERFTVQTTEQFLIALNGVANSVAEGYIADMGVVRQFWPPNLTADNPIIMTTDTELSYATATVNPAGVEAICTYDARTGRLILSNEDTVYYSGVLAPPPRSAGQYVCRFTIVSGDIVTHFTDDTWHDVFEEGNLGVFENYLLNANPVQSFLEGEGTFSIAVDDGAGAPVGGTIVSKTINFKAELVGDNLSFTTAPWSLTDVRYNEPAYCILLSVPSGFGTQNEAFFTGSEHNTEVIREIYAVEWGLQFTVQVDVVAGTVTGDALGVPLSTDVARRWRVDAPDVNTSVSATVDVTYDDGVQSVTKQVTMLAQYDYEGSVPPDDPGEIADDWTQFDRIADEWFEGAYPLPATSKMTLTIYADGTLNAIGKNGGQDSSFPQNWHVDAPSVTNANDYECRLTVDGYPVDTGSQLVGQWLNLSSARYWNYFVDATGFQSGIEITASGTWVLEVREVGRPDTVKQKTLDVIATAMAPDDGGVIP